MGQFTDFRTLPVFLIAFLLVGVSAIQLAEADSEGQKCRGKILQRWDSPTNSWIFVAATCYEDPSDECVLTGYTTAECQCLNNGNVSTGQIVPAGPNQGAPATQSECACHCEKWEEIEGLPVLVSSENNAGDTVCRTKNYSDPITGVILYASCEGICVEELSDCDWGQPNDRPDHPNFHEPLNGTQKWNDCICHMDQDPFGL